MAKKQSGKPRSIGSAKWLQRRLISKSLESYLLSLELINRPSLQHRVEVFCFLTCNAWELLLKARILTLTGDRESIVAKGGDAQAERSITLEACLTKLYPDKRDLVRRNVEFLERLRNSATHLVITRTPPAIMGLFQSTVLNYHKALADWFRVSITDKVTPGMMSIVYDVPPDAYDPTRPSCRRALGRETATYLAGIQQELQNELVELGRSREFALEVGYRLYLVKKDDDVDFSLTVGAGGVPVGVVEKARDPGLTHPFLSTDVVKAMQQALGNRARFTSYDAQCIISIHDIRKRNTFYFKSTLRNSMHQYSQAFVDWMLAQYEKDPRFFEKARSAYYKATHGR